MGYRLQGCQNPIGVQRLAFQLSMQRRLLKISDVPSTCGVMNSAVPQQADCSNTCLDLQLPKCRPSFLAPHP